MVLVIAAAHAQPPLHSPACIFNGADLHDKSGATIDGCSVLANHSVALYFAGEWCPLCRRFTPALREFHRQDKDTSSIVFVSSDASREDATTHFANSLHSDGIFQVGWESDLAASLKRKHRVWSGREIGTYGPNRRSGVPCVVVIDSAGEELTFLGGERYGAAALRESWNPSTIARACSVACPRARQS